MRLRIGDAVGFLLDLDAQPLGQVAAVEWILPPAQSQKDRDCKDKKYARRQ